MAILLISAALVFVIYGLTLISYMSENNIIEEMISNK